MKITDLLSIDSIEIGSSYKDKDELLKNALNRSKKIPANLYLQGFREGCPVGLEPTTFRTTI